MNLLKAEGITLNSLIDSKPRKRFWRESLYTWAKSMCCSVPHSVEGIALILGVERLLDMLRTAVNITGDAACAVIVDKGEDKHVGERKEEATA